MRILFTKMHGLGNDFVLLDHLQGGSVPDPEQIRFLADRRFGVGCDQLLLIEPAESEQADIRYRIFNADGGEVAQCGNGARCVAVYLHQQGYLNGRDCVAETAQGVIVLKMLEDGQVIVNMGAPGLEPAQIPLLAEHRAVAYILDVGTEVLSFSAVSMGNPHAVITVADVDQAEVISLGPIVQRQLIFPEGVNVGFMQVLNRQQIRLRVYERGSGETLACGSGACAAVVAGIIQGVLDNTVNVELSGGHLTINWQGEGQPVYMTGPAKRVYEGQIDL